MSLGEVDVIGWDKIEGTVEGVVGPIVLEVFE